MTTARTNMSKGSTERASALRRFKHLRAKANHAMALSEHPRLASNLDTQLKLKWQADEWYEQASELDYEWGFTPHSRAAALE